MVGTDGRRLDTGDRLASSALVFAGAALLLLVQLLGFLLLLFQHIETLEHWSQMNNKSHRASAHHSHPSTESHTLGPHLVAARCSAPPPY